MLTINPVNLNTKKSVSFKEGSTNNLTPSMAILSLQAPDAKRGFTSNMHLSQKADAVRNNLFTSVLNKFVKTYNIAVQSNGSKANNKSKGLDMTV
uniref:hypothetical protein n=1 Tax=Candidatus Scatousia sp. TaxID=3085663 RepID=UPI0040264E3B